MSECIYSDRIRNVNELYLKSTILSTYKALKYVCNPIKQLEKNCKVIYNVKFKLFLHYSEKYKKYKKNCVK